ncbi:hypothetical protein C8R45DRAFT_939915 [Mycena sanguinolenta]|nr:hypothetical protein C8R45DRAFT_939915 [Mycena sanguinolenta]
MSLHYARGRYKYERASKRGQGGRPSVRAQARITRLGSSGRKRGRPALTEKAEYRWYLQGTRTHTRGVDLQHEPAEIQRSAGRTTVEAARPSPSALRASTEDGYRRREGPSDVRGGTSKALVEVLGRIPKPISKLVEVKEVQYEMYTRLPGCNTDSGSLKEVWRRTVILRGPCAHPEPERQASERTSKSRLGTVHLKAKPSSSPSPSRACIQSARRLGCTAHFHRLHVSAPRPDPEIAKEAEARPAGLEVATGRGTGVEVALLRERSTRRSRASTARPPPLRNPLKTMSWTSPRALAAGGARWRDRRRSKLGVPVRCERAPSTSTDAEQCVSADGKCEERDSCSPSEANAKPGGEMGRRDGVGYQTVTERGRNADAKGGRGSISAARRPHLQVSALRLDPHCEGGRAQARKWKRREDEDEVLCSARRPEARIVVAPVPRGLHPLSVTHLVDAVPAPSPSRLEVSGCDRWCDSPEHVCVCVWNAHTGKYAEGQGGAESEGRIGGREVSVSAPHQGESSTLLGDEEGHILNCIGEVNRPRPGRCDLTRWTLSSSPIAIQRASPSPIRRARRTIVEGSSYRHPLWNDNHRRKNEDGVPHAYVRNPPLAIEPPDRRSLVTIRVASDVLRPRPVCARSPARTSCPSIRRHRRASVPSLSLSVPNAGARFRELRREGRYGAADPRSVKRVQSRVGAGGVNVRPTMYLASGLCADDANLVKIPAVFSSAASMLGLCTSRVVPVRVFFLLAANAWVKSCGMENEFEMDISSSVQSAARENK